ncbi:ParB N-terminal domain-containing protein [Apibacter adventoris]|uniref:Uncharacterized protein n=1 Tax=Apibacter adventoris TaxID=1679466 RepID=A0A2S8A4G0_9FLAO|nr:hypothetical protein [Apibacter adventoris]PQL89449.1 hypothetical protein C4S77_12465 [Apibacter adventoris]
MISSTGYDTKGKLGYFIHEGVIYVNEENHNMTAALLYQAEKRSSKYVDALIKEGESVFKMPEGKVYKFSAKE